MRKMVQTALVIALAASGMANASTPEQDRMAFEEHYLKVLPGVPLEDYKLGALAISEDARSQAESMEEFPPYEEEVEKGQKLFETPFANGKTYASCFPNGGIGIRQNYPMFDAATGKLKTIESEINACREKNGEKKLGWKKGDIAAISAYMASTSEGKKINIVIPDDERAQAFYEQGKQHYYAKRGQLNLSCANCHYDNAGKKVRAELLSPSLGHVTHFPVYRQKWKSLGTLHRRFGGCNEQVRAASFPAQSDEYKALEYFLTYMSNGHEINNERWRK